MELYLEQAYSRWSGGCSVVSVVVYVTSCTIDFERRCLGWELDPFGTFLVQYARFHIDDTRLPTGSFVNRQNRWIPIKISIFIWRVMIDRIATQRNLNRCDTEVESLLCQWCSQDVSHLFFKFSLVRQLWSQGVGWNYSLQVFIASCLCWSGLIFIMQLS